ncbi:family 1 extracellular solute-binding protein [Gottschalkia acidurici 9a]|uniref:Family 1 extracellular solute-binding protein n=1 Tax=Gottschalkia acidurici (strain ATCC 7906 / DSM 604 / BCRC 14475 / CIP 104303 / KCTC 5404 / NCIMB 10678 / 9a) TaxID=1128398 RepID=K0B1Q2_GOTA9|nr:extracellular solute-binding protein [Gottschalkia acidurici]AFS79898.1 family 1 extracellular solute-binding protein [Gottschalkia acidurici 9a]
MKNMKKLFAVLLCLVLSLSVLAGCSNKVEEPKNETKSKVEESEKDTKKGGSIILSTTTSTQDSGLLDFLLPKFEEETGIKVKVIAVGTGEALQKGKDGDADILLVHSKVKEEQFVKEGHGTERKDVMYNDFILVGPKDDSLKLKEKYGSDIVNGFKTISENKAIFVSRADKSGTHDKEMKIWETAGIKPEGDWYMESGRGMGDTLKIASEKKGYTLTDRATYLSMKDVLDLDILVEKDENLFNQYGIIPVNPEKNNKINAEGAKTFMDWMLSAETQKLIGEFGVKEFGQPLFVPNAK